MPIETLTYAALGARLTGAGLIGAPPTETGPTGLGSREGFLRNVRTTRAQAFGCGMEEVVTGVAAFCRASVRAASEES
jgi:hypothetical protein